MAKYLLFVLLVWFWVWFWYADYHHILLLSELFYVNVNVNVNVHVHIHVHGTEQWLVFCLMMVLVDSHNFISSYLLVGPLKARSGKVT